MRALLFSAGTAFALALPALAQANELGQKIFTQTAQPPCALCHALKAAGATGTVGPSLDDLKPDKAKVLTVLHTGVGVMPRFAETLSEQEMEAVAEFVAQSAGK